MYNTTDTTNNSKPTRLKKILFAIVFMAIGAGITSIATGYYWSGKYDDGYRIGKIDQAQADNDKAKSQQNEDGHRLAEKLLPSSSN